MSEDNVGAQIREDVEFNVGIDSPMDAYVTEERATDLHCHFRRSHSKDSRFLSYLKRTIFRNHITDEVRQ